MIYPISALSLICDLLFTRLNQFEHHTMDDEMLTMIKKKFPVAYDCATEVAK